MSSPEIEYAFLGGLREDYCITPEGRAYLGMIGGNAVFSAVGARLWTDSIGLFSRVGSNYPTEWLAKLKDRGFNIDGIKILPEPQDTRTFYAYLSMEERVDTNPASHFLRINKPLPKALIDYKSSTEYQDDRNTFGPLAIRPDDLTSSIAGVRGVHLAPSDFLTHTTSPYRLSELGVETISLDPSERYMEPGFKHDLPLIVNGITAFLPSESDSREFFKPHDLTVWEMAEAFADMGCRFVVIKRGAMGQCIWDPESHQRWRIPAYPAHVRDVTGAGDAYCGGFLVGLVETGDVVEAALRGSVSASIVLEGIGALYALDVLPQLVDARLEALRPRIRQI